MPLQQEYLRHGEVSSPRFMASNFQSEKVPEKRKRNIQDILYRIY